MRAYEFASPGLNQAQIGLFDPGVPDVPYLYTQAAVSPSGDRFTFQPFDVPVKAQGSQILETALAQKGPNGWLDVESLAPPLTKPSGENKSISHNTVSVSPDFTESIALSDQPLAGPDSPPEWVSISVTPTTPTSR